MRTLFLTLMLAGGITAMAAEAVEQAVSANARPVRTIIGVSPFLQKGEKDAVFRKIVGHVLEEAPLNSSVWIYDAFHLRTVALIDLPDVRAFRSSKTRANQFKEPVEQLREFLAKESEPPKVERLSFDRAVRLPQFLDFVSENLISTGAAVSVVILGSPLYMDAKEPSFSMGDGAFPSDAHLEAGRDQTVYGLKSRERALERLRVHQCWFGDPWISEVHREKVGRFWSLYLEKQGAQLATFCGDLPTAFNALKAGPELLARAPRHELDRGSTKVEMLRVSRDVAGGDWITREVISNAATTAPSKTVGPMKIGIRWKGDIDLDLYSTPEKGAQTLFFENTRSAEGYYFKDHRSSPEREYEFIEFEKPVDVWQVEARINFFEGRVPAGPGGEVRIEFGGRIYTAPFELRARHGNEGRTGQHQRDCWAILDVPAILKLRDVEERDVQQSQQEGPGRVARR